MRTGLLVVAGGAAVLAALPASASPARPVGAATVSVATYLPTGTQLPATLVTAAWSRLHACSGRLSASGNVVTGTTTVVTADWTSRLFRPNPFVMQVSVDDSRQMVVDALPESLQIAFRMRPAGGRWSRWQTFGFPTEAPSPVLTSYGEGGTFGVAEAPVGPNARVPRQQVEVRLTETLTSTASVDQHYVVQAGCAVSGVGIPAAVHRH